MYKTTVYTALHIKKTENIRKSDITQQ